MGTRGPAPQVSGRVLRPVTVQAPGTFGPTNPLAPARSSPLQPTPQQGPAIKLEKFVGRPDLDPNTARALDQLQTNLAQAMQPLLSGPNARYNTFVNTAFTGGVPVTIKHGLGTTPHGVAVDTVESGAGFPSWIVTALTATAVTIIMSLTATARVTVYA